MEKPIERIRPLIRMFFIVVIALDICCLCTACARPRGELKSSLASPDGQHTMNIYFSAGSATVDWSYTVTIKNNQTGRERNIYFQYHDRSPSEAYWVDNETVRIEGRPMNIDKDYYESMQTPKKNIKGSETE